MTSAVCTSAYIACGARLTPSAMMRVRIGVAGIIFHLGQTIEQFIDQLLFLRGHCGSPWRSHPPLMWVTGWSDGRGHASPS